MNANSLTKVTDWLKDSQARLEQAGVATTRLDCLVLLEDATGKDRGWLLAHPEHELQRSEIEKLNTKITRRGQHIPLAYIRGKTEFYGREFTVNAHTLVPRPETETIITLLRALAVHEWQQMGGVVFSDIGTGSGAIAISAKLEFPESEVYATDIDEKCLKTAQHNAKRLGADITFLRGNLLEPLPKPHLPFTILLCNLPYVPEGFQINRAATHEPKHALFGGPDGLDLYRELFTQTKALATRPVYILTESLPPQHETLTEVAQAAGYALARSEDFIQVFQFSAPFNFPALR